LQNFCGTAVDNSFVKGQQQKGKIPPVVPGGKPHHRRSETTMINLLAAATSTPKHVFKTSDLVGSLMHKLSPELINTINSLGV